MKRIFVEQFVKLISQALYVNRQFAVEPTEPLGSEGPEGH
jgi:hypothetical protein